MNKEKINKDQKYINGNQQIRGKKRREKEKKKKIFFKYLC